MGTLDDLVNPDVLVSGMLDSYAQADETVWGGTWIDRDHGGTIVLAFTEDAEGRLAEILALDPTSADLAEPGVTDGHFESIAASGTAVDTVQVQFTLGQLLATQEWITPLVVAGELKATSLGPDIVLNRVFIGMDPPTPDELALLMQRASPDELCLVPPGTLPGSDHR